MKFLILIISFFPIALSANSFCIKGDCTNGFGEKYYAAGKYIGEFSNGKPSGKGIFKYKNGDKYMGKWFNGKKNGEGKLTTKSFTYIGSFKNDQFEGKGTKTYVNGKEFSGTFRNGTFQNSSNTHIPNSNADMTTAGTTNHKPQNKYKFAKDCNSSYCDNEFGTYTYRDGSVYKGYFKYGKPDGQNVSVDYHNGHKYEGGWKYHTPHGSGTYTFGDGTVVSGTWDQGKLIKRNRASNNQYVSNDNKKSRIKKSKDSKIWAVIVGVASYNHMPSLRFTDDDAYKMYAFLKSPEGGALPDEQIKVLIDDEATKKGILSAMDNLYAQADENDQVMLYFSGHGLQGSFVPHDFDGYNNQILHDEIQDIFDASAAKHKVCYIDACYSGGYASVKSASAVEASINKFYQQLDNSSSSTAFLLSSKASEISLEYKGLRQGIFTHFLMRGMKGEADYDSDKIINISELFKFVNSGVKKYTAYTQNPVINGNFDRKMPVALIR